MKIWLTGSSGFIGKYLVSAFQGQQIELQIVSNQMKILENKSCIYMDYLDPVSINKNIFKLGMPDIFIHLGWGGMAEPESSIHLKGNIDSGRNLISVLFGRGLRKFIFVGSMNEYGGRIGQLSEDMLPQGRLTNYAKGKIEVAKFGFQNAKKQNKIFIHVRPFYVYGVGQREGSLINELYQSYCKNIDIDLSPCEHYRDYIHVSDVAEGLRRICAIEESVVVNLGSGAAVKVKDFVLLFWKLLGGNSKKLNFGFRSLRDNEPEQPKSYADLTRLKSLTNWSPAISLEEGIKLTIRGLENNLFSVGTKP